MGTDLHLFVEQRLEDGRWAAIRPPDEFVLWGGDREEVENDAKEWEMPELVWQWNMHRNYRLFSILADVRNGFGFAGCDTGDGFVPIAQPRGLPDDLSPELASMRPDHDASWLLWEEVAEYPHWREGMTKHRGWVDAFNYRHWVVEQKRIGAPFYYIGGAAGPGVRLVEQKELDRQLETIPVLELEKLRKSFATHGSIFDNIYTVVEWPGSYREAVGTQWWRFFEVVQGYGINAKNLRLVFYFDS